MGNTSRSGYRTDLLLPRSRTWHWHMMPFAPTLFVVTGLSLAPLVHGRIGAQTYVQLAELNPNHPIGARITSSEKRTPSGAQWMGATVLPNSGVPAACTVGWG